MNKIYIDGLTKMPSNCNDCKVRGTNNWVCQFVKWNHNVPIYFQKVKVNEADWYDGKWKHPDCPLKIVNIVGIIESKKKT